MTRKRRIQFTKAELDAIINMESIAGAGSPDGDYASWTDKTYAAASSAADKAAELLNRKGRAERTEQPK